MNGFLNIGNKAFVNVDKIICIMAADSHKVYRILARANLKRKSPEVIDTTSDNETRSIIFLDNNKYCISSVNASVLAKRAQGDIAESVYEKTLCRGRAFCYCRIILQFHTASR